MEFHGAFEPAGDRVEQLRSNAYPTEIAARIEAAITETYGKERASEIAFHLCDWIGEAAWLVALHLYPERFSDEEIEDELTSMLNHAPHHLAAAAH